MWLVWYYILISWRQWHSLAIILFTLLIMIILSPTSINYDVSLQLSFLAVIWIIYCNKYYLKIFNFLPNTLEIKTAFCLTLSALTTTLPIIIVNFWYFSILSPLSNIAVSWTIALAMLWWFVSIILYIITPILWIFIWYFVWVLLKWDIIIVHLFWQAKWALLEIDLTRYNTIFLILYFMILIYIILKNNIKKNN
jgi:predicted membrane metal-binding protein